MKTFTSALISCVALTAYAQTNGEFHLDKEYAISPAGTLTLTIKDARVRIAGTDRATAHVKIDRVVTTRGLTFGHQEFGVDIKDDAGNLDVRERSSTVSVGVIGYYSEKYTVTLELPKGVSLVVKGSDGRYAIDRMAGAISLRVDDASVELTGCTGDKFEFRLDDGDLKMDQGRGSLDVRGNDTNVHIQNAGFTSVRTDLDDGNLVIETSLADRGNYSIQTHDGLVFFTVLQGGGTFDVHHSDGRVTTDGPFNVLEKSERDMRITLAKGSANVNIHSDDGRIKLASK